MKHIKLYEDFLNEETQFPAQFEIDEAVSFITAPGDDERWGTIVKVSFTKAKVWYDILDDYTAQVIEDVDSSFVKTLKSDIKLEEPTNEAKNSQYPKEVEDLILQIIEKLPVKKYQMAAFNNYGVWFIELPMTAIHSKHLRDLMMILPDFSIGIYQGYSGLSIRTNIST
jgi:hypothetical protein